MKKGNKVRVISDNRIGIIADQMFFTLGGKKTVRVLVKFEGDKQPVWMDRSLLTTELIERVTITFRSKEEDQYNMFFDFDYTEGKGKLTMEKDFNRMCKSKTICSGVCYEFLKRFFAYPNRDV